MKHDSIPLNDMSHDIHRTAFAGDWQALRVILGSVKVDRPDAHKRTALHWAAAGGNVTCIRLLLDAKARVNAQDGDRRIPLCNAISFGQVEAAQTLIHRRAKLEWTEKKTGRTLLHLAVLDCPAAMRVKLVEVLVRAHVPAFVADAKGFTALDRAVEARDVPTVQALVKLLQGQSPENDAVRDSLARAEAFIAGAPAESAPPAPSAPVNEAPVAAEAPATTDSPGAAESPAPVETPGSGEPQAS